MVVGSFESQARRHAALGDVVRLRIVDELCRSDRTPKELGRKFCLPSNLLAHHLDVLEDAGIIERLVSAGDGRRRYVRLLAEAAGLSGTARGRVPARVLFVCTRNSARSQLAAALWRERTGCVAQSAGTHPASAVSPGAIEAAARAGLSLDGAAPARLGTIPRGTRVITVCDLAREELSDIDSLWHWSIPAPSTSRHPQAFDRVVAELSARIERLGITETKEQIP